VYLTPAYPNDPWITPREKRLVKLFSALQSDEGIIADSDGQYVAANLAILHHCATGEFYASSYDISRESCGNHQRNNPNYFGWVRPVAAGHFPGRFARHSEFEANGPANVRQPLTYAVPAELCDGRRSQ
jgi:hypothetical protein